MGIPALSARLTALAIPAVVLTAPALAFAAPPGPADSRVIGVVGDVNVTEASGLAMGSDGQLLYMVEDAGKAATVYGAEGTGKPRQRITVPGTTNEDWEDLAATELASGKRVLFIGDIGDAMIVRRAANKPGRTVYQVIRINQPDPARTGTLRATGIVKIRLAYPGVINRGQNAEALLVQPGTGQIFLVNKTEKQDATTTVWAAPAKPELTRVNLLRPVVAKIPVFRASGGAFSPTGDRIVIRNETTAYVWWVKKGDVAEALQRKPIEIPLPQQRQGEGISFTADGHALLVNSEGPRQPIWQIPLPRKADVATAEAPEPPAKPKDSNLGLLIGVAGGGTALAAGLVVVNVRRRR